MNEHYDVRNLTKLSHDSCHLHFLLKGKMEFLFFISCSFLCRSLGSMVITNLEETHPISTAGGGHLRDGNISSCKCRGGDVK